MIKQRGPLLALISSFLFGISPVFAKFLIGEMSPILLAGLLYLGSGLALSLVLLIKRADFRAEFRRLNRRQLMNVGLAIVSGGIIAPVCLTYGLAMATAFEVSVLLNLESVFTTVIAFLVFREHVGKSVWAGKALMVFAGILMCISPSATASFSLAGLLILGACLFWGIDNNLTRDIEDLPATTLACVKGLAAGAFNSVLALMISRAVPSFSNIAGGAVIGAFSYGLSLVLFIEALRLIGASRTSTYFTTGPFFGMLFSVLLLGERPEAAQWFFAFIMGLGLLVLYFESHEHAHKHEPKKHNHKHVHDQGLGGHGGDGHHTHTHAGLVFDSSGRIEHEHEHAHEEIVHSHSHFPDIHHRHLHGHGHDHVHGSGGKAGGEGSVKRPHPHKH